MVLIFMNTRVSIIVPVYNTEEYLRICVDQILQQAFQDFELILIDDGSQDNSLHVCNELAAKDPRIRVIHQENKGVSGARNTGIEQATGEYIAFVDSDDMIAPDYLKYLQQGMKESDRILSMCGHERIYDYDHVFPQIKEQYKLFSGQECAKRLLTGCFPISACGCLFKRSLIGALRFTVGIRNNEDKLFLYQYLLNNENGKVAFSNEKRYGYLVRDGSATRSSWNGSVDLVKVADIIREETVRSHPEWDEIARQASLRARLDVMKSIVRAERSDQGEKIYNELRKEVLSYGWPKSANNRLKVECLAVYFGKMAYKTLAEIYYKVYSEKRRFRLNEEKTRQG